MRRGPRESKYEIATVKSKSVEKDEVKSAEGAVASSGNADEELLSSLSYISRLRKELINIQIQQLRDRRRLNLFSENNKNNRNEIIVASLLETAIFILAGVFQIYFVRNWFAKKNQAIAQNGNPTGANKLSA